LLKPAQKTTPHPLTSTTAFAEFIAQHPMAAVYFSGPDCGVCTTLKPKLLRLFTERFPKLAVAEVDCGVQRELAAQQGVFTIPTLIVYLESREGLRKTRSLSPGQVEAELERPYSICFGGN